MSISNWLSNQEAPLSAVPTLEPLADRPVVALACGHLLHEACFERLVAYAGPSGGATAPAAPAKCPLCNCDLLVMV